MVISKVYDDYLTEQWRTELVIKLFSKNTGCNEIETMFLSSLIPSNTIHIRFENNRVYKYDHITFWHNTLKIKLETDKINKELDLEAQKKIDMFRPDFVINDKYIIEIDGHEFHEKTKDQVRKDKQRERYLQKKGYTVIRFSGSEVYNNSLKCWDDLFTIIINDMENE